MVTIFRYNGNYSCLNHSNHPMVKILPYNGNYFCLNHSNHPLQHLSKSKPPLRILNRTHLTIRLGRHIHQTKSKSKRQVLHSSR
ncbi:hypothetical protein HanRHA438_Chr05g0233331 [Helianthus annuus]|nr:hypothetical protein HanHA89_Chr05g0198341 [Helianthus annuus]KAJ0919755.1 hypothetical protein HanRHA438_Chr05g0233331 [Helianthus annuus]